MKRFRADAIVAGLLVAAAMTLGSSYARALRIAPDRPAMTGFDQRVFGAALMGACGRGLTTPSAAVLAGQDPSGARQPVQQFLAMSRESIRCDEIPADLPVEGLDGLQRASRYLLLAVSAALASAGPGWAGVDRLIGLMFAASIVLAYGACRAAMGQAASAGVAVLLLLSPLQLQNLANVRDYSKAPFLFAALCAIALVATRRWPAATLVAVGTVTGAVLGVGVGMRTDVLIDLLLVLTVLLALLPGRLADTWKARLAAALACVAAFTLVAAPLLGSFETRSSPWHVALLGYANHWDQTLAVEPARYEVGYFYDDSYVATMVNAYWGRVTGDEAHVSVGMPHYGEASRAYYFSLLATFPADAAIRGWASVIKVLQLPFSGWATVDGNLVPEWLAPIIAGEQRLLGSLHGLSIWIFGAVALAVSVRQLRLALLMLGLVVILGAYPAIQFQQRHVFHLEMLSLWTLGFAASQGWALAARKEAATATAPARMWRPLVFVAVVVGVVIAPIAVLRAYQQRTAGRLLATYQDAAVVPFQPVAGGFARPRGGRAIYSEMLVVNVGADCGAERVPLKFSYLAANRPVDFSRQVDVPVPAPGHVTQVFFPVFETGGASPDPGLLVFRGVEVPAATAGCVSEVSRFAEPDRFPLLLPAVLPDDWRSRGLHQSLR